MPVGLYEGSLMTAMGLIILVMGAMTIAQCWKQGNFVGISGAASFFFLALSALIQQFTGLMSISMVVCGLAIVLFLFTVFVVAPMAFRRSKKRRPV
jgi:membrane-bound ClpP family serine protease